MGLSFAVDLNKPGGFIGREALLRWVESGLPKYRLAQFLLDDPEPLLYYSEPIYRDGLLVGYVLAGNYGHTLGGSVALGHIRHEEADLDLADWEHSRPRARGASGCRLRAQMSIASSTARSVSPTTAYSGRGLQLDDRQVPPVLDMVVMGECYSTSCPDPYLPFGGGTRFRLPRSTPLMRTE